MEKYNLRTILMIGYLQKAVVIDYIVITIIGTYKDENVFSLMPEEYNINMKNVLYLQR